MKITEEAMILFANSGRKTVFTPNSLPQRDPVRKIKKLKTKREDLRAECSNIKIVFPILLERYFRVVCRAPILQ